MCCLFFYAEKTDKNSLKIVKCSCRHCEIMVKCTHPFKNRLQFADCIGWMQRKYGNSRIKNRNGKFCAKGF